MEQFENAISTVFAAEQLCRQGFFFRVVPDELKSLIDRAYQKYPGLEIDMEIANAQMQTLAGATNAVSLVKEAMTVVRTFLKD